MSDVSKLTLPANFSSDRAPAFAGSIISALDLPADTRLNFENLLRDSHGQTVLEYSFSQSVQLEDPDLGPARGVTVDVPSILTLRFDKQGNLVDHQVRPADPHRLDAVRANVKNLVARGEVHPNPDGDAEQARAARKPYYLSRDEQGKLRLRRAFMT